MKKFLSILLSVILVISSLAVCAYAADNDDIKVTVANDIHFSLTSLTAYTGDTSSDAYAHVPSSGQLLVESNAIITAFFKEAAKNDSDIILLPGDLVNTGVAAEHLSFSEKLAEFEATSGKQVYVIPGNHDMFSTSVDEFKTYYAEFGYNEAIAVDDNSASYVVDLNNTYRLLAIDSTIPGASSEGVDAQLVEWVEAQCVQAAADGKYVIAMMHHNLVAHFILSEELLSGAVVSEDKGLSEVLASNGVKVIFTGHTHDQDIATYTAANGNVIYDVVTNTLNAYPVTYRTVTFGDKIEFKANYISKIDTSLLPEGLSDEAVALAGSDFTAYSKKCIWHGLSKNFQSYLTPSYLKGVLKLNKEEYAAIAEIFDKIAPEICEIAKMPLYKADEIESGKSIESLVAAYGKTLPESDYTDVIDLAITFYQAHCVGDENYPAYSDEVIIMKYVFMAFLGSAFNNLSSEDYVTLLTYVCELVDVDVPESIIEIVSGAIDEAEGIEIVASALLVPVITQFSVDESPADNNLSIAGYGQDEVQESESIFTILMNLIKKIISFLKSIKAMFS